jgi:membrane-associated phospholipid phosphatase
MNRAIPQESPLILPLALRGPVAVLAVFAALVVLVLGVIFAGDSGPASLDRAVEPELESSTAAVPTLARAVDFAGEPVGLALLVAVLAGISLLLRRPWVAVLALLGTGLSITVTTALKPLVGRTIHGMYLSYPSGHTASATSVAMIAVLLVWHRLRPATGLLLLYGVSLAAGAAAGWSQAGRMAHYPSDTVGGWCTALAVVPAAAWLIDHASGRWPARRSAGTSPGAGRAERYRAE